MLVTSNLEFSRWSEVFGDPVLTAALLDRLTHHSHILVFEGESYRFSESQKQEDEISGEQLTGVVNYSMIEVVNFSVDEHSLPLPFSR